MRYVVAVQAIFEHRTCSRIKAANDSGPRLRTRDASSFPAPSQPPPTPTVPAGDEIAREGGAKSCSSRLLARTSEPPPPPRDLAPPLPFSMHGGWVHCRSGGHKSRRVGEREEGYILLMFR